MINVILTRTSLHPRLASPERISLSAVAEVFVSVGSVYVIKLSLEKCMENTVKRMIFLARISMEVCVLGMESVKGADASASVAGKGIGASVLRHRPSAVSIPKVRCAAEEARVCVARVSALTPGASAAFVSTALPVIQPAVKTGIVCSAFTLTICLKLYLISVKPPVL